MICQRHLETGGAAQMLLIPPHFIPVLCGTAILVLTLCLRLLKGQRSIPNSIQRLLPIPRRAKMKTQCRDRTANGKCREASDDSHLIVRKHA
jgi:hypothetical protein